MSMNKTMKRKKLEEAGLMAIAMLRKEKLRQGHPFMINLSSLPMGQCYLEFPNGVIQLVKINQAQKDFEVIKDLTPAETKRLKEKLQLA
jgi:hypothetical protein